MSPQRDDGSERTNRQEKGSDVVRLHLHPGESPVAKHTAIAPSSTGAAAAVRCGGWHQTGRKFMSVVSRRTVLTGAAGTSAASTVGQIIAPSSAETSNEPISELELF